MPSIDIVIVNWNAGLQLRACLESVIKADKKGINLIRVVIVDNASTDLSLENITELNLPLNIIRNDINLGFAAACNQGAQKSKADYLLFLNPDTILNDNSLTAPVCFMQKSENTHVGITGIQLVDEKNLVSRTCAEFPTPAMFYAKMLGLDQIIPRRFPSHAMSEWDHNTNKKVDHVIGAFFLVRTSLFRLIQGFDTRYFVYLEDLDFSLRAKQNGFDSYYLADVRAFHKGGGTSDQIKATRLFYSLRSRILYANKHFNAFSASAHTFGTLVIEPLLRLIIMLLKFSRLGMLETIQGYAKLWQWYARAGFRGRN